MNWFFLAFISAFFSATSAITQKKVLFKMEAVGFSFFLSVVNLILVIPFFLKIDFAGLSSVNLSVLFFKTILTAVAFWCVMLTLKNFEISGALPLLALTPGFVAIVAFFVLNEHLKFQEISGIALLIVGTYLLEAQTQDKIITPITSFFKSKKYFYVVAALLLFTISSILDKALLKQYKLSPDSFMAFQHLFFFVIFGLIIFSTEKFRSQLSFDYKDKNLWYLLIGVAIMTVVYRYTFILSVKTAPAVALVLAVKRISVFFATIAGGKIFKEKHLLKKGIAAAIIIAGAILISKE